MVMATRTTIRFPLGRVVATPGALKAIEESGGHPKEYLDRHASGDWGCVDAEDWKANDDALRTGARLLSAYKLRDNTKIWVITEAEPRAATTLLLPNEY